MSSFHEGQRSLQEKVDSRRLAARLEQTIFHDALLPNEAAFISSRDFFFSSPQSMGRASRNVPSRAGRPDS